MYKANRMSDSFSRRGVQTKIVPNDRFLAVVGEGGKVGLTTDADFAVYLDKDKYVQYLLEKAGIAVFNSARSTELCDDKMMTHIALVNHGIDMPMTLGGALCYSGESQLKKEYLKYIADTLGLPLVVKSCYGSYGQQVHLADNYSTLKEIASRLKNSATLFQRYVKESHGKDMRVIVVGGKAVAWMTRRSEIDFRSNVEAGGKGYVCDLARQFPTHCGKKRGDIATGFLRSGHSFRQRRTVAVRSKQQCNDRRGGTRYRSGHRRLLRQSHLEQTQLRCGRTALKGKIWNC